MGMSEKKCSKHRISKPKIGSFPFDCHGGKIFMCKHFSNVFFIKFSKMCFFLSKLNARNVLVSEIYLFPIYLLRKDIFNSSYSPILLKIKESKDQIFQ